MTSRFLEPKVTVLRLFRSLGVSSSMINDPVAIRSPLGRWNVDYCEKVNLKIDFANNDNGAMPVLVNIKPFPYKKLNNKIIRKEQRPLNNREDYYWPFTS